jgi:hypothetical protein
MRRSVTVFVRPIGRENGRQRYWLANTLQAEAIAMSSPELAATRCGARHMAVSEDRVEATREDEHVWIVQEKAPARVERKSRLLWVAAFTALIGVAALTILAIQEFGGAL